MSPAHHFTVDVEEYFHPSALEAYMDRSEWDSLQRRAAEQIEWLLGLLDSLRIHGTFFVLGWLAKREPEMVKAIARAGHEISSHGWDHRRVNTLSPEAFREDVASSRHILQDLTGQPVMGYRAPSFSILPGVEWALDVLIEEGFAYDSSMFPVKVHPAYGYPACPRDPHVIQREAGSLVEIPPATLKFGTLNLPAAGGAYLRFFPSALVTRAFEQAQARGSRGTLYLHPWELDEELPPVPGPWLTQIRMRAGTGSVRRKVERLARRFRYQPMRDTVAEVRKGGG